MLPFTNPNINVTLKQNQNAKVSSLLKKIKHFFKKNPSFHPQPSKVKRINTSSL